MNSLQSHAVTEEQVMGRGQASQAASWPPDVEEALGSPGSLL